MKCPVSDDAVSYVALNMNFGGCVIHTIQIMPAQPGTYALIQYEPNTEYKLIPIVAWGVWDAYLETDRIETRKWTRHSGPMIFDCGRLIPVDIQYDGQFAGVRIGNWQSVGDGEDSWIPPEKESA